MLARGDDGSAELDVELAGGVKDEEPAPEEGVAGAAEVACTADGVADGAGLDTVLDDEDRGVEPVAPPDDAAGVDVEDGAGAEEAADEGGVVGAAGATVALTILVTVFVAAAIVLARGDDAAGELGAELADDVDGEEPAVEEDVEGAADVV